MSMRQRMVELAANEVTKQLMDQGKLVEAGFTIFRELVIPANASPGQIADMRKCWFAGAQHVFHSIMSTMDPGEEITENDMRRVDHIDKELRRFAEEMLKGQKTAGSA